MADKSDLKPIPTDKRIMDLLSYLFLWLGGCVSIGTFALGSGQLEKGLNLTQALLAMILGSLLLIVCLCLNDQFSYRTGIPYAVQLKSAFGTKGNILPAMLRGVPAIVWYGVQSWLGGTAINQISLSLFNYDNVVLFFLLFQALQIWISTTGFHGLKWLENIGACVIIASLAYMLYICMSKYGGEIEATLINKEGTWGIPFVSAIVAFFGVNVLVMLNVGDYVRELKAGYSTTQRGIVYFLAMVPATVFMGIIGLMISSATGIANPITAFARAADNQFLVITTLIFILFAQMTTNLASNVVPPAYALMDAFKIKHKTAVVLIGLVAIATCPWLITSDASSKGVDIFVLSYTVFFGPIFSVLIVDYYILRKGKIDIDTLYDDEGNRKGVNWAAILAITVGAVIGLFNADISFLTATIPTGVVYYYAMKHLVVCKRFREGTVLDAGSR